MTSSTFEKGVFIQTGEVAGPSAEVIIIFSTQLFNPACRKLYFFYLLVFKAASLICVMMLGLWTGSESPFADVWCGYLWFNRLSELVFTGDQKCSCRGLCSISPFLKKFLIGPFLIFFFWVASNLLDMIDAKVGIVAWLHPLLQLKEEAVRTLSAMKDRNDEGFDVLFMTQSDYCSKFDYHVR